MHKVYLLLRNNQQTGPYSLEELLQLNLKPFDLVWVDGRSAAWRYPGEVDSLKAYVPATPQPDLPFQPIMTSAMEQKDFNPTVNPIPKSQEPLPAKNIFVSLPRNPRQVQKPQPEKSLPESAWKMAEDLSQKIENYTTENPLKENTLEKKYSRPLNDVEDDYTSWVVKQTSKKKNKFNKKDLTITALIIVVILGGYYLMSKPSIIKPGAAANRAVETTVPSGSANEPLSETGIAKSSGEGEVLPEVNIPKNKTSDKVNNPNKVKVIKKQAPIISSASIPVSQSGKTNNVPSTELDENTTTVKEPQSEAKIETPAKEKKKKLGEVLRNVFGKSKDKKEEVKNDPPVLEEPKPATDRQSTRREESSAGTPENETGSSTALADLIDLSSNSPDSWMMGVTGLKITLRNRSNTTIQTAAVDVLYYDENKRLLEKKMVYFNNVPPKGKLTIAAPDHKWADHVAFKLAAVSSKDDRYVGSK